MQQKRSESYRNQDGCCNCFHVHDSGCCDDSTLFCGDGMRPYPTKSSAGVSEDAKSYEEIMPYISAVTDWEWDAPMVNYQGVCDNYKKDTD